MDRIISEFSASDFMSAVFTQHSTKLITHTGQMRESKNASAIHESRVAIRTINAHLNTFAPFLRRKPTSALTAQLDRLNSKLGAIRNTDAMIAIVAQVDNYQVKQALLTRLQIQRLGQELELQKVLDSPRLDLALTALANYALRPPLRRKFLGLTAKKSKAKITAAISHTWVLLFENLDNLPKRPNTKQLHRARITVKQCRYAYEAAAGWLPSEGHGSGSASWCSVRCRRRVDKKAGSLRRW
jgi:CHAD domain-containing protein